MKCWKVDFLKGDNMEMFKILCWSKCGSYFNPYLKSVTIIADSKDDAVSKVKGWLEKEDRSFIYPESEWKIVSLSNSNNGVVDFDESSDY
jgi:hypothetical protein